MREFKVGDTVKIIDNRGGDVEYMGLQIGQIGTVIRVEPDYYSGELPYQVDFDGRHMWPKLHQIQSAMTRGRLSSDDRAIAKAQAEFAKAQAELAKLKERAAAKAKQAADRKAKAERAKIMRGLSAAGRRVLAMLQAGSASDFGCQRESVIKLASAITGDDPEKIKKALL